MSTGTFLCGEKGLLHVCVFVYVCVRVCVCVRERERERERERDRCMFRGLVYPSECKSGMGLEKHLCVLLCQIPGSLMGSGCVV